jgi:hypothetical protein
MTHSSPIAPSGQSAKPPAIAWLVPLAAVVAIVGVVLPWFKPIGYAGGKHQEIGVVAHAWQGGAVGVLGPILLVIAGVIVLRRILRSAPAKPGKNPVRRAGMIAALFAVLTYVAQLAARGLVLHGTVDINGQSIKLDDLAGQLGYSAISRGTQIGFWITAVAALLALVGGIAMFAAGKKAPASSAPAWTNSPASEEPPAATLQNT